MRTRYLTSLVVCLGLAGTVQAQEISGGYVGLAAGYFSYEDRFEQVSLTLSDNTTAYRFVGGYQLNSVYTIEASWQKTDPIDSSFAARDQAGNLITLDIGTEHDIAAVRFLALAPFRGLSMFGGIGYFDMTAETTMELGTPDGRFVDVTEADHNGVTAVGGMQYDWDRIALRGEYEWFDTDGEAEATSINVVMLFRF